jgi:hypothetical protein
MPKFRVRIVNDAKTRDYYEKVVEADNVDAAGAMATIAIDKCLVNPDHDLETEGFTEIGNGLICQDWYVGSIESVKEDAVEAFFAPVLSE